LPFQATCPGAGLTVTGAGKPVDPSIEIPVPIDPGSYPVEAAAPGHVAWKGKLAVAEGKTAELVVPALAVAEKSEPPRPPPVTSGSPGRGRRIAGLAITGLGAGGIAAGVVFGMGARSHNEKAKELCGGDIDSCDPMRTDEAQAEVDDARSAARLSNVAFIAGGALVVTGMVLFITAPKAERRAVSISPLVGPGTAGFTLSGRY
jgi:hypothetical protein